jgi:Rrf2 family protein
MFKLSRKVEYALMALNYLHRNKNRTSVRDICAHLQVPFDTVSKVLQILNAHSIVGSEKGINGGYYLKDSLSNINLYDFCQFIEPKPIMRQCHHSGENDQDTPCELMENCNITSAIYTFNSLVSNFLKQITLQELLENPEHLKTPNLIKMQL